MPGQDSVRREQQWLTGSMRRCSDLVSDYCSRQNSELPTSVICDMCCRGVMAISFFREYSATLE
jgi:hypothetical protein